MSRRSPYRIVLTPEERSELERRARRQTATKREVFRAQIVVLAADGLRNDEIAERLGTVRTTVSRWRKRFFEDRSAGLADRPRSGRPRTVSPSRGRRDQGLACERPANLGLPLSRLSHAEIARIAVARDIVEAISVTTVWRWLGEDALKPWRYRSWIFPRDPDFERKAGLVLDLYCGCWQGPPLRPDEHVVCADEKTSIQARARIHPGSPPARRRAVRVEQEYERRGALAYLAAWDVHRAQVFGRCEPTTGIAPFGRLVDQVMRQEPYASARRVFWVVTMAAPTRARGARPGCTSAGHRSGSSTRRSTRPG
jgi:transposase